jgi:hypothetical protein
MANYTVVGKGELKKAGSYLKQILTLSKPDGSEVEAFTWVGDEDSAEDIKVGDVLDGELSYTESKNPKYKGEWKIGKWTKVAEVPGSRPYSTSSAATGKPNPKLISAPTGDKDERIARGNACNAISSLHAGKAIEPNQLYAEIRQMYIYITTGMIPEMSTKLQHEAILAMFSKDEDGKKVPDLEAAHEELFKSTGIPFITALTRDEAAGFLASMTPD